MNKISISFIIVHRNNLLQLKKSINSILLQDIDDRFYIEEIIVSDGNSNINLESILNLSNVIKLKNDFFENNQEARRLVAAKRAIGDLIFFLDSDNYFYNNQSLIKYVNGMLINEKIFLSYSKWYGYDFDFNFLNKYFSLIGGVDPVSYFLRKNDRNELLDESMPNGLIKNDKQDLLYNINFTNPSTLGCNGVCFRKEFFKRIEILPKDFLHTDSILEFANEHDLIYVVDDYIYHETSKSLYHILNKRLKYFDIYDDNKRIFKVFDSKKNNDIFLLAIYCIFSITFLPFLIYSIYKFRLTKKAIWFLHPFICFLFFLVYGFGFLKKKLKNF